MKHSLLIGLTFFLLLSCEKNTIERDLADGIWIEKTQGMDTLFFAQHDYLFDLNRGTELRNGYLLPKFSSGAYSYKLKDDSISLIWMPSSSLQENIYYFEIDSEKGELQIGNFFVDSLSNNNILTFSRHP